MLRARNDMAHMYNRQRSNALVTEILTRFLPAFETMDDAVRALYGEAVRA